MRKVFLSLAVLNFAVVAWAIWDETVTRRPWKAVQAEFNALLRSRGQPEVHVGIRELTNPLLGLHDRCETCHLAINTDGFGAGVPAHLRTHPRRAELIDHHPSQRFGCTTCHDGQGPQTKGVARAKFDHGRDDPHWERPLLRGVFAQASCLDCHEQPPRGAEVLARGRELFETLQCGGCHLALHLEPVRTPPAPSLVRIKEKSSQAFVEEWLRSPAAIRPGTRMPELWPSKDGDQPRAIAAYLAATAPPPELPPFAFDADLEAAGVIAEGRALFNQGGCRGCHLLSANESFDPAPPPEARFGPSLEALGEKATAPWLAAWLTNPKALWSEARMPHVQLSAREVTRLVAFLVSLRREGREAAVSSWASTPDPALVEAGRAAILELGCAGCHELPGIPREGRPGPDLDGFGDRPPEELSFGAADVDCGERPRLECFAMEKLRTSRRFVGPVVEKLVMPQYNLAEEDLTALTVFLLSNRDRNIPAQFLRPLSPTERALHEGEALAIDHNCAGCHQLSRGEGGWIRRFYEEPALAPPSLVNAGQKLQVPWLWDFLRAPGVIRPFLRVRMPDYQLPDAELDALAKWLSLRDGEPYPIHRPEPPRLTAAERPEAARMFQQLQCAQCHPAPGARTDRPAAELAPDLALASKRLRPNWVRALILDPQKVMPGTRMPTYFSPLDEENPEELNAVSGFFGDDARKQADILTDVVMDAPP